MNLITQITENPSQSQVITIDDGSSFSFTIQFIPMQICWVITNLTYGKFQINGVTITVSPNIFYQFMNQIPFGIACYPGSDQSGRNPSQQQDFSSGAFNLFLLTQAETQQYAQLLSGVSNWNATITYSINFLVIYNGIIYSSLVSNNLNNLPTNKAFWETA